jgi:hypothetical protein
MRLTRQRLSKTAIASRRQTDIRLFWLGPGVVIPVITRSSHGFDVDVCLQVIKQHLNFTITSQLPPLSTLLACK